MRFRALEWNCSMNLDTNPRTDRNKDIVTMPVPPIAVSPMPIAVAMVAPVPIIPVMVMTILVITMRPSVIVIVSLRDKRGTKNRTK
jgi:hypothetical protein